eukprot:TRINITY_DN10166_c0_g1_i1.p1 TRINITY_DN10166_c0_g1~~TRINITY_DN10166_c0_g1_i1.p1  ORF type:complete len:422 (-),score=9.94 TRINITY_DN10166_c0_g1_i1:154-1419(-)
MSGKRCRYFLCSICCFFVVLMWFYEIVQLTKTNSNTRTIPISVNRDSAVAVAAGPSNEALTPLAAVSHVTLHSEVSQAEGARIVANVSVAVEKVPSSSLLEDPLADGSLRQLEETVVRNTSTMRRPPHKGVVVYMCTSLPEDLGRLKGSLRSLDSSFCRGNPDYPVAIFHEDFTLPIMNDLQDHITCIIHFVKIAFDIPSFIKPKLSDAVVEIKHRIPNPRHPTGFHTHLHGLRPYNKRSAQYPFGYYHMCRFYAGAGIRLPFFDRFDWYWRLDSDSSCHGTIDDPFDFMERNNKDYGYLREAQDGGDVVEGLWNAVVNYTTINHITPTFLYGSPHFIDWGEKEGGVAGIFSGCPMFYTNFELVRVSLLRSERYQNFFKYLDRLGGIYMHRWGDAPIRWLGLATFLERSRTVMPPVSCSHP